MILGEASMAKRKRAPRQRRVVPEWKITLLRPVLRWSSGRGAFVLRVVGNSVGPVYVREGDGAKGSSPSGWTMAPIPLDDYADGTTSATAAEPGESDHP